MAAASDPPLSSAVPTVAVANGKRDREGKTALGVWEVWIVVMLMLRRRRQMGDWDWMGEQVVKDGLGSSWVWVDWRFSCFLYHT